MLKTFKVVIFVSLVFSLTACSNGTSIPNEKEISAEQVPSDHNKNELETSFHKPTCPLINFPKNLQYLNQVKCMDYPIRSEDVLDLNTSKLKNGQYDLRTIKPVDQNEFFSQDSEFQERWRIVAKFALSQDITTFILMSNLEMEGEGFAQTYNLFSVNNKTAKIMARTFNYVGFDRREYDLVLDTSYDHNSIYFLQDKSEIGKCTKEFEILNPKIIKTTRTCWNAQGVAVDEPSESIFDIKHQEGQVEYIERYTDD